MMDIAQIGCGNWGPNLLRNFYMLENVHVKYVADKKADRRKYVSSSYKDINVIKDYEAILKDGSVDAVIIATEPTTHFELAKAVLNAGKHCLVEKPLAMRTQEAQELISLAEAKKVILMVGHTFLYNSAVRKLKELIDQGTLGDVYYIYSQRLNLGHIRTDINALWNFAPHDVSISLYLIKDFPQWVSAVGASYIQSSIEDVIFLNMGFKNEVIVNIHISWLDPNKVRRMTVVGSRKMVVYDDVSDSKIQIYDKSIDKMDMDKAFNSYDDFGKFQLIHRAGDLVIPKIDYIEPLSLEAKHFVDCIVKNERPLTDGYHGLIVTKILEAGMKSLSRRGERIELHQ
jgi:predicted dehydrogenase